MAVDRRAARLSVLALVGVILFSLLGARMWFLQTVKAEELEESSARARTRTVRTPPERGRIFDAEGRILADNKRILTVAIDWQQLRRKSDRDEIFRRISGWIDVPIEAMEARFDSDIYDPFLPMPLKEDVGEATALALLERIEDFPGLQILPQWQRVYPYAPHAAHVVGYMGAITAEQIDGYLERGYLRNERVGQFGVELSLEDILHGAWGKTTYEVDAANRPVRVVEDIPPINGFDVQLTIDLELQQYAEQAVETTLEKRRDVLAPNPEVVKPNTGVRERMDPTKPEQVPYKAPAGSAVIMNYETGEVLAMASYPTFDNRWFEAGLSSTKFQQIFPSTKPDGTPIDPDESILVNRAIQGRYNLGSTFKPFTAYAALSTGLMTLYDEFEDTGTYKLSADSVDPQKCAAGLIRCEFKNATCAGTQRPCVYGKVTIEDALAVSSDTFFYSVGENIMTRNAGLPILQQQVELFQFGSDTGIELPYEFDGTVPDAELKKEYAERGVISQDEGRGYYVGDNVQLAIGQGLLSATPLQVANAYGTIANGGTLLQPTLVKAVYYPGVPDLEPGRADLSQGTIFDERAEPRVIRQVPMPPDVREPIVDGLTRVVYGDGITSTATGNYHKTTGEHLFFNYPDTAIPIAGKTGTAQGANNYPWNDSSVFAAFSLDEERPYVVSAYLEKAGYGSQAAAPVVKCTFLVLSGERQPDPVVLSPPLELSSTVAAPSMEQRDQTCWLSKLGNGVETGERSVD